MGFNFCLYVNSKLDPHQVVSIIECDFAYGGTARVRQVGITVVDRECAKTCNTADRKSEALFCFSLIKAQISL